ncbi:MAG: phytoene desaturase family protein [Hyphomicrobium sp.]
MTTKLFDAIIIGGGHNGLTTAGYLARKGLKVKVLEARHIVGGAAVTEEFYPGFRNSICSYTISLLHPKVISDLELHKYGLTINLRDTASISPLPDGRCLVQHKEADRFAAELAQFSNRDSVTYPEFDARISEVARALRDLTMTTPPNIGGGLPDLMRAISAGNSMRKLSLTGQKELAKLMTMSVGDYLNSWFDGDAIKGSYGYVGVVGNMQSVYSAGTAYVLLHHAFGVVNGVEGAWGHAIGGMGAITQAMAKSAAAYGADIEVSAPVKEVLVKNGRAVGVVTADGRRFEARVIAANVNPKLLFGKLVDSAHVPADFKREMDGWRCRSGSFRMNVALAEFPKFTCMRGRNLNEADFGSIVISPSLDYAEHAFQDALKFGWSRKPIIEMWIPSVIDSTLAPPGQHVASLFCQHFDPYMAGKDWDDVREEAADLVVDTLTEYAPNFKNSVIGRQILSPKDLERIFGLVGGDIFHGALHLDQIYSLRPAAGYADYRMPIPGLYLCGSGAHPGGGVSGIPGHNAAREILKDLKPGPIAALRRARAS